MAGFHLQTFFASGKALLCRYLLQTPLFSFTQNRGKFAPNCLALPLSTCSTKRHTGANSVQKSEPLWLASLRCFLFCELLCSFDENYSQSDRIFSRNFVLCACMITLHIKSKSLKSCLHFPFRKSKTIIFSVCYLITFIPICSAQFR